MNTRVFGFGMALLGTAIGGVGGYFVGTKLAEKKANLEIESIKKQYKALNAAEARIDNILKDKEKTANEECKKEESEEVGTEAGSEKDEGKSVRKIVVRDVNSSDDNFDAHAVDYSKFSEKKKKGGSKKKPVAEEISEAEWDAYEGNATVYRDLHWYPNADGRGPLLVDQSEEPVKVFIDSEEILNCFSEADMHRFNKDEIYILTKPGVGDTEGIIARVAIEYDDFFRDTDLAWNSTWAESGEETGFNAIIKDIANEGFKDED